MLGAQHITINSSNVNYENQHFKVIAKTVSVLEQFWTFTFAVEAAAANMAAIK